MCFEESQGAFFTLRWGFLQTGAYNQEIIPKMSSFVAIFGIYCSLRYLSLSDATVLTFLAPLVTVFAGALFLGEKFTRKEVFASRKPVLSISFFSLAISVSSVLGVVLIARPNFLFGDLGDHVSGPGYRPTLGDAKEERSSPERLIGVG